MLKCSERDSRTPGFPARIMAFVSPGLAHVTCAMRTLFSAANAKDVAQFGVQCRVEKRSYCYPERHGGDLHITFYPRTGVCGQETSEHHWVGFFFKHPGTARQKSPCTMRFGVRERRRFSRANAGPLRWRWRCGDRGRGLDLRV
jgi:hypothetical protein